MSYSIDFFLEDIRRQFDNISFEYQEVEFKGKIPSFFVHVQNEETMKEQWVAVSKFIAGHFQSALTNEFSVWNIYVFFCSPTVVSNELKYTIENDTFSSRKIVVSPEQDMNTIIKEHILNDDLIIQKEVAIESLPFSPHPIIWRDLNGITPKKKVTEEIVTTLNQIIEKIKNQQS